MSLFIISFASVLATLSHSTTTHAATAAPVVSLPNVPITLYNGVGSPNGQGFFYQTLPLTGASAKQVGNNLDSTPVTSDKAGFFAVASAMPLLDRNAGYTVRFTAQVNAETHVNNDRAGFSIIVLSNDHKGIELGFWTGHVWAQTDDSSTPQNGTLFTHGEDAAFNTTSAPVTYDLIIQGDKYTLKSGTTVILNEQPLRDYTSFGVPYTFPNFLFLGDDTTSAAANVTFGGPITITPNPTTSLSTNQDTALAVPGVRVGAHVQDPNGGSTSLAAQLSVNNGTLAVNGSVAGGVSAANISGNGTATVALNGTRDQINATFADAAGIVYQPATSFSGSAMLTVSATESGSTGTSSVPIIVVPAPTATPTATNTPTATPTATNTPTTTPTATATATATPTATTTSTATPTATMTSTATPTATTTATATATATTTATATATATTTATATATSTPTSTATATTTSTPTSTATATPTSSPTATPTSSFHPVQYLSLLFK